MEMSNIPTLTLPNLLNLGDYSLANFWRMKISLECDNDTGSGIVLNFLKRLWEQDCKHCHQTRAEQMSSRITFPEGSTPRVQVPHPAPSEEPRTREMGLDLSLGQTQLRKKIIFLSRRCIDL